MNITREQAEARRCAHRAAMAAKRAEQQRIARLREDTNRAAMPTTPRGMTSRWGVRL